MSSIQDSNASKFQQDAAELLPTFEDYELDDINAPANMSESHIQAEFPDPTFYDYSKTGGLDCINAPANYMSENHIQAEFLDPTFNDYSETCGLDYINAPAYYMSENHIQAEFPDPIYNDYSENGRLDFINAPANNIFESHIQAVELINQNQYPTFHSHSSEDSVLYDNTDINMSDNYGSLIQAYVNNLHVTLTTPNSMSDYQGFDANTKSYKNGSSQSSESCEGAEVTENKSPCIWDEAPTLLLLKYLKENKEKVIILKKRGSTAGKVKKPLWEGNKPDYKYKLDVEEILRV
ncbi:13995_t:CDS:10 [Funneliformis caledonium]|uniref:13995_t:CDS:1 n=1 Tax=Funneliformis caledonium TaxID=1117310 RepID=A0A9N8YQ64_9GLOM|nr:13995_t:CDS:10 [Funneliformis caledonium]